MGPSAWAWASSLPFPMSLGRQSCPFSPCQPAPCRPPWELQSQRPQVFLSLGALGLSVETGDLLTNLKAIGSIWPMI